jgi:hypothetical protein
MQHEAKVMAFQGGSLQGQALLISMQIDNPDACDLQSDRTTLALHTHTLLSMPVFLGWPNGHLQASLQMSILTGGLHLSENGHFRPRTQVHMLRCHRQLLRRKCLQPEPPTQHT